MNFTLTTKNVEIYSPFFRSKVNSLFIINILKEIGIIFITNRKELYLLFI